MGLINLTHPYSSLMAWLYDRLFASHAFRLHTAILDQTDLDQVLAEDAHRHVLDVGCGGGQLEWYLKENYPHLSLTGIDLSEDQIRRARQRAG